ncbi:MAG TPA: type VI secretion system-associated protein TagF [Vicinamibacterales bacterium]|nr:type VI secretion system-associated protein TagF [Vicinamibacterales bacterium]
MDVGLFGKLPSHGDFLRRRVSDQFIDSWDAWLRQCLAKSQAALGDRWVDVYLTSPAWRFVAAPRACGPAPVIGLMVPSVDRVGRFFPLTLVAELPEEVSLIAAAAAATRFFNAAERLLIDTLADEQIDFEQFDQRVVELADELEAITVPPPVVLDPTTAAAVAEGGHAWQIPVGDASRLGAVFEQLLAHTLASMYSPLVMWWTEGSSIVEPSCLVAKGLPDPAGFGALLDGSWASYRWRPVPAQIDSSATIEMRIEGSPPDGFRSAAASDVGLAREINEDSFIERPEVGIWAVADGLGGHAAGEVASKMVCDAIAELAPDPTFDGTIEAARQCLRQVNEQLLRAHKDASMADRSASTVVVLLVRGGRCAVLWAGDSRVYRWRSGQLEQMTRDHSIGSGEGPDGREVSTAVTRAVGVQPNLSLDLRQDTVCAGDRFLLCSDGLTRTLTDTQIGTWLEKRHITAAVEGLIDDTLAAGAPDNVTVLIVEGYVENV